jgi:Carboxypeptidase regulatory-like domain
VRTLVCMGLWMSVAAAQVAAPLPAEGNVAMPLDEYNRLTELAARPGKKSDAPPMAYAIQRADIQLTVAGGNASGTVQLEGEVFATGAVRVPLIAGITMFDARRQGGATPLMWEGASHTAVLNGPGNFDVTLELGMPVSVAAGSASVTVPAPAAGAVRLTMVIPGDSSNVTVRGGLMLSRVPGGGKTTITATLTGGQPANVSWATREAVVPAAPKEARYLADVKSLVTVGEAGIAIAALAEVTVVQGEPAQFEVAIPADWEVTGATGPTLESSEMQGGALQLKVTGAARAHAFLITMERPVSGTKAEVSAVSIAGAQRETGEIVVEGEGTMELSAKEAGGVKRMDGKEASAYLRSMAHQSMQAAFRYHRQPGETPGLSLEWTRFPETTLLAAVTQSATVTTLVTSEGRSLTEVKLWVRNREQPFMKVALPAGASIVSAEVAGEAVKPVQGADGSRVPLLRAGFRPTDAYSVSFVIMHSGVPFAQKGGGELALPKMDVPIGLVEWEVFLPERYRVKDFGGDAVAAALLPRAERDEGLPTFAAMTGAPMDRPISLQAGMIGGYVVDPTGALIPRARVTITHEPTGATAHTTADASGRWMVLSIPPGRVRIETESPGFKKEVRYVEHNAGQGTNVSLVLEVGAMTESVEVTSSNSSVRDDTRQIKKEMERQIALQNAQQQTQASVNVANLQRRVAGVLPIPIDVPKAGNSYRFVRPLVVDEETKVTFTYRAGR